ncbi:MAG TPA: ABC transporter substrate-binding protein [Chloroflexota bacterium]|nr:ABC transporter substrate-binding protein [Chloroflexota bacterium]
MRRMRPLALAAVVAAAALVGLPLAAQHADTARAAAPAQQRTPLSVGLVSITALAWPFFATQAIGAFDQEGLAPETTVLGGAPQVSTAVVGNSVDLGVAAMDIHIRAVERGGNAVWWLTEFANPVYRLLARPDIRSYADLRGRTIMVDSPNGITYYLVSRMLRQAGLGPDDYNFVYAGGTPERLAALVAGGVDASVLIQPFDFAAERQGYRDIGRSTEVVPAFEFTGYTSRPDWLRANEDTVARFIRAYQAGQRWLYDPANKDQAIQILTDQTRIAPEDARATYELYVEQMHSFPPGGHINPAGVQAVLDALVDLGQLTAPTAPPSKYVDPSYVDRYGQ